MGESASSASVPSWPRAKELSKLDRRWIYKRLLISEEPISDIKLLEWIETYIAYKVTQRLAR
jgi:hypothetical protein